MLQPRSLILLNQISSSLIRNLNVHIKAASYLSDRISSSFFYAHQTKCKHTVSETSNTEYLVSLVDKLLKKLNNDKKKLGKKNVSSIKNDLAAILYQLFRREKTELLLCYFEDMVKKNVANEAAYRILMRHYMERLDVEKCHHVFNMLKGNEDVLIRSRSYVPLIELTMRCENFEKSHQLLDEMVSIMGVHFDYSSFYVLLERCIELRTVENYEDITCFADKIFNLFQDFGHHLNSKLIKSICKWFLTDPNVNWNIVKTKLFKNEYVCKKCNFCHHCKNVLQTRNISPQRLQNMEENLLLLIKAGIIERENKNKKHYKELYHKYIYGITNDNVNLLQSIMNKESLQGNILITLGFLQKHIEASGPYDIIIDGVNMSYLSDLTTIVDTFVKEGKKILLICAGVLRKELLVLDNLIPADEELKKLLLYLQQHSSLFFIDSVSSNDDYYVLYTLLLHHFDTQLVSSDYFRDHLAFLDVECRVDFLHWQKSNQYFINKKKKSGSAPLLIRNDFHCGMQRCDEGWHIPICSGSKWFCVSKC